MFLFIYSFICLAEPSHSCGIQGLLVVARVILDQELNLDAPTLPVRNLSRWTTREVPTISHIYVIRQALFKALRI